MRVVDKETGEEFNLDSTEELRLIYRNGTMQNANMAKRKYERGRYQTAELTFGANAKSAESSSGKRLANHLHRLPIRQRMHCC